MKHLLLCVILSTMPVRTVGASHRAAHASQITEYPEVRAGLNWFSQNLGWINEQQIRITEAEPLGFLAFFVGWLVGHGLSAAC